MTPEPPQAVFDSTDQTFQNDVVEKSKEIPVLVDFWAPWCEPCKVLGPTLERMAAESNGGFLLAKVNMDENPMLAQALQIKSIPNVKLVVDGKIQNEFAGALPEPDIKKFLEENLPGLNQTETSAAMTGIQAWLMGDVQTATTALQAALQENPEDPVAKTGWANLLVDQGQGAEAKKIFESLEETAFDEMPEKELLQKTYFILRGRLFLVGHLEEKTSGGKPELDEIFQNACRSSLEGNHAAALEGFLAIVKQDRTYLSDGGRMGLLAVFDILSPEDPLLNDYRGKLSSILFS